MTAYFACANKTGQHFLLKKYDKREFCMQQLVVHWVPPQLNGQGAGTS
jgi:hypothetical protein